MYGQSQKQKCQAFLLLFLHSLPATTLERSRTPDLQSQVYTGLPDGEMTLEGPASELASIAGGARLPSKVFFKM